jgi:hypothetical protein
MVSDYLIGFLVLSLRIAVTDSSSNTIEREPGKDYSQGFKTYGFAAPFSKIEDAASVTA